jgi:hypothetical protein
VGSNPAAPTNNFNGLNDFPDVLLQAGWDFRVGLFALNPGSEDRAISDKTKHHAELAAAIDRAARFAGPEPLPRCACGHTWMETHLWVVSEGRDGAARLCCSACAPADLLALISARPPV